MKTKVLSLSAALPASRDSRAETVVFASVQLPQTDVLMVLTGVDAYSIAPRCSSLFLTAAHYH